MNLILLFSSDFTSEDRVRLQDHRAKHILEVHQAEAGRNLKVGLFGGNMGIGQVIESNSGEESSSGEKSTQASVELQVAFNQAPPEKLPLTVVLALPRPKMLRRIIQNLTALGVSHLVLINSYRVEKSYWQTPFLAKLDEYVQLGLEQAVDTQPMTIELKKRFKPYVEDELPALLKGKRALVAHPYVDQACPRGIEGETVLVIGPEGGFIQYEVDKLIEAGCEAVSLGQRIQKVETVLPQLIGRLF